MSPLAASEDRNEYLAAYLIIHWRVTDSRKR
jgi:hypothetical protein